MTTSDEQVDTTAQQATFQRASTLAELAQMVAQFENKVSNDAQVHEIKRALRIFGKGMRPLTEIDDRRASFGNDLAHGKR